MKPEWLEDEKLGQAGDAARVLSAGLILLADDYGRGRAALGYIAAHVWTYELEKLPRETLDKAEKALASLEAIGYLAFYDVAGERYYRIVNWEKHQRVDRPGKPHVPAPPEEFATSSRDSRETLAPDLRPPTSDQDQDPDLEQGARARVMDHPQEMTVARVQRELVRLWPTLAEDIEGQWSVWEDAFCRGRDALSFVEMVDLASQARAVARAQQMRVDSAARLLTRWFQNERNKKRTETDRDFLAEHAERKRKEANERRLAEQLTGPKDAKPIAGDIRRLLAVVGGGKTG